MGEALDASLLFASSPRAPWLLHCSQCVPRSFPLSPFPPFPFSLPSAMFKARFLSAPSISVSFRQEARQPAQKCAGKPVRPPRAPTRSPPRSPPGPPRSSSVRPRFRPEARPRARPLNQRLAQGTAQLEARPEEKRRGGERGRLTEGGLEPPTLCYGSSKFTVRPETRW